MKLAKRVLVMVLVLSMLIGTSPTSVWAEGSSESSGVTVDDSELTVEGTNGFGNLLSEEITEQQEALTEDASSGYTVTGLAIEDNLATVTYDSLEEATLVVALYTEDGTKMLLSGSATVQPEETQATITLQGDMPEYFLASAYLLDSYDMSPLCPSYDTPLYTKEMQELLASTVDDYDADRVLNLDEDKTTNFAVYAETTKVIERIADKNIIVSVDDANAVYVIDNPDSAICSLEIGEIFVYPHSNNDILIVKVVSIAIEGNRATIIGDDITLDEAFSHIKIASSVDTSEVMIDDSTADAGVTFTGISRNGSQRRSTVPMPVEDGGISLEAKVSMDFIKEEIGLFSFKGSIEAAAKGTFEYYFTSNYKRIEFKVEVGSKIEFEIQISGKPQPLELKLLTFTYPILPGMTMKIVPTLVAELAVSVSGTLTNTMTAGFGWSFDKHGVSFLNLCEAPSAEIDAKLEGKVFLGLRIAPTVEVVNGDVIKAEMSAEVGFEITGKVLQASTVAPEQHNCKDCIDGNVSATLKLKPTVEFLSNEKLRYSVELANYKWDLFDFYICNEHARKGIGKCPNKAFRVTVTVVDAEGNPIADAKVTTDPLGVLGTTNNNGVLTSYLAAGEYKLFSHVGESIGSKDLYVYGPCSARIIDGVLEKYVPIVDSSSLLDLGSIVASGSCGPDARWVMYSSGIMHIDGYGDMTKYTGIDDYDDSITHVIIADGITSICDYAFKDCNNLTFVNIPYSVTRIGEYAFTSCHNLRNVDIPSSVRYIDYAAFQNCVGLTDLTIPDSVIKIGNYAFQACTGLTSVTIGSGVSNIGSYAFNNCSGLTDVIIPSGVEQIKTGVFGGCSKLENVCLPEGINKINSDAFYGCGNLKAIIIPITVTEIGSSAFAYTGLMEIVIPAGVTRIGDKAFHYCNALNNVSISDTVTHIGKEAFFCCTALTDVRLGAGLQVIYKSAFYGCTKLQNVHLNDIGNWCAVKFSDAYASPFCYARNLYMNDELVTNLVIPEGVTGIAQNAFKGCSSVTSVTLPSSMTSIGSDLFANCESLKNVTISNGVETIEANAFYQCIGLTDVVFPQSVTSIGAYAFDGCTGLNRVTLGEGITRIGYGAFGGCTSLQSIEIPDSVINIGESAFSQCTALTSVSIGKGVTTIGCNTFYECSALTNITLSYGLTTIGSGAFEYCKNLKEVALPDSVISIEERAFYLCSSLTSIAIPASVTYIGSYSFCYCRNLNSVVFAGNAPMIESDAFYSASATAYYPDGNETWTVDVMQNYSGKILWQAYTPNAVDCLSENTAVTHDMHANVTQSNAILGGECITEQQGAYTQKTASFTNLVPGAQYVLLSMAEIDADELLSADNLLYIDQAVASEEGTLTFCYVQRVDTSVAYVMVCGPSNKDLAEAVITFPEMVTNGALQTVNPVVSYEDEVLVEGRDYLVLGDVDFTEAGDYVCYIRGICNYIGLASCAYSVTTASVTVSGTIESFGESDTVLVSLLQNGEQVYSNIVSGNSVEYCFKGVPSGAYTLRISKAHHATQEYSLNLGQTDLVLDSELFLIGDVNCDGKVNMKDWNRLYEHLSEVNELTGYSWQCADITGDGKVNMKDWNRLYEHLSEVNPLW